MKKAHDIIRGILEVAPIGIYIVNKKGGVDYMNSTMVAISGTSHKEFKSLNVFSLPAYKKLKLDEKIRSVFLGHSFSANSVKHVSQCGKKTTTRNMIGIPLEEGGQKKALIFVEDITKIKEAEEEMREAMNIKSQFISTVSHELRTPLTAMEASIAVILDKATGSLNETQKKFLTAIQRNIERLSRLINNVLDLQKLEAGRTQFIITEGNINSAIEDVAKSMAPLAKNKGLKLELLPEGDLPEINFDKDKIIQVLTNLVNNAIKFTNKGKITVASARTGNVIRVSVRDTGIGIKKNDLDKLFHYFSQVEAEGEKAKGSTGLGLAISKGIIKEHRGKMEVKSRYGKGSTFSFVLPIVERRGLT